MNVFRNPLAYKSNRRQFLKSAAAAGCLTAFLGKSTPILSKTGATTETAARFYQKLEDKNVQCNLCFRHCLLAPGDIGHCEIRINRDGELKTMGYGNPGAINIDPIEKKPFFHVYPGTLSYSLATVGCNIDCKFCQNWQIAQAKPGEIRTSSLAPKEVAPRAKRQNCKTIAFTYSEPTVWSEYVIDIATAAKKNGVQSVIVSNGTWAPEVLQELLPLVTAIKIDLKSIEPKYYRDVCNGELKPVLDNIIAIKKAGIWLELVNLIVTSLNDTDEDFKKLAQWVKINVGDDVPLHFSRFHPMYRLKNLASTPVKTLDNAAAISKAEGLNYIYIGNVPGHSAQSTHCPRCRSMLIERSGYWVKQNNIQAGKCPKCGIPIAGIWI